MADTLSYLDNLLDVLNDASGRRGCYFDTGYVLL